jgi:predicted alpha-1,2-mannosidase
VQQERVNDFINSMLAIYQQQGKLPIWHLHGNETNTMVGYSAVPVIADAYLKGFRGFDAELAFEAMKTSALLDERGGDFVKSQGYIPADSQVESVARGMEYAIDDWALAAMAEAMGKTEDAELFAKRAKYYKNYFDSSTGFMRGKMADGSWRTPFNPISSQHREDDYCEGNAWQYTWLVPHDVEGLIELFGTKKLL